MQTTTFPFKGTTYEAEWDYIDDENIVVYLPNGPRETWLRGLDPDAAARNHLRAYVLAQHKKL